MSNHHFSIVWDGRDKQTARLLVEEGEDTNTIGAFFRPDYILQEEFEKLMAVLADSLGKM